MSYFIIAWIPFARAFLLFQYCAIAHIKGESKHDDANPKKNKNAFLYDAYRPLQ